MSSAKPHRTPTGHARRHWPLLATLLLVAASACGADRPQDHDATDAHAGPAAREASVPPGRAAPSQPDEASKAPNRKRTNSPFAIVLDDGELRVLDTTGRPMAAQEAQLPVQTEEVQSVESLTIIRIKGSCYHLICYRGKCYKLPC